MFRFIIGLALLGAALAESPLRNRMDSNLEIYNTNVEEPAYRLDDSVQPRTVSVELDVNLDDRSIEGVVTTDIIVSEPHTQIVMHQKVVRINGITVTNSQGLPVLLRQNDWVELDDYFELMKINFESPLEVGEYTIRIAYTGQINDNPLDRGFYRGYYLVDGVRRYYATTQFQPYHARKAFPCFDEPKFKARYTIAITRPTEFSKSYSNMAIDDSQTQVLDNGRTREVFLPTPLISAYLIAFHVSDFVETVSGTAARPIGIVSRPGVTGQHEYAAEMADALTTWMSEYLDNDYYGHGQEYPMKNDHIALPDFPSGAMENWGMVNYREAYLLYDDSNTNILNKIFIATIVSHELAHKWFGNLVTCFWWSNLWLNESFASFFEYFGPHAVDDTLELDEQFVVDYVHSALSSDSNPNAWAMNYPPLASNQQISAHFSPTSYAKGASVFRMLEHLVGASTWQKGLQIYLRNHAYGVATPQDLYDALSAAVTEDNSLDHLETPVDIAEVFGTWVNLPGSPVLNVDVNHETGMIQLSQHRFLINGDEGEGLWSIPLTYTRANDINFENTQPIAVMTTQVAALEKPPGHEWVIFNIAQSGLYRVMYDHHSWEMLASALKNDREVIHRLNRAQIGNDVLNFVRAGTMDVDLAFEVLDFLSDETDYYVWAGVIGQLDWIRRRFIHIPELLQAFEELILEYLETVIEDLGYEELTTDSTSRRLNRMQIMNLACNLGHAGCVEDSQAKWDAWKADATQTVPANLRRYVYCTGIRNGDESDFDFLWQKYIEADNTADMVVILRALGCTNNQDGIDRYLAESRNSDHIRIHDKTNAFSFALQGNPENPPLVINNFYANYEAIRETYGGSDRLIICINALATYLNDYDDVLVFQDWWYDHQLNFNTAEFNAGVNVIATATNNIRWGNDISIEFRNFFRTRSGANSIVASLGVLFSALLFHLLK